MVMRVTFALGGAGATRGQACLKRRVLRVRVRIGLATEDAPGVSARVRAIEAEPDATSQRFDIGLGEARVGADRARCGARGALVDARRERGDVGDEWTPMRSEDLFDAHLLSFGWMRFSRRLRPQKPVRRPRARAATWSNKRFRESWRGSLTRSCPGGCRRPGARRRRRAARAIHVLENPHPQCGERAVCCVDCGMTRV